MFVRFGLVETDARKVGDDDVAGHFLVPSFIDERMNVVEDLRLRRDEIPAE